MGKLHLHRPLPLAWEDGVSPSSASWWPPPTSKSIGWTASSRSCSWSLRISWWTPLVYWTPRPVGREPLQIGAWTLFREHIKSHYIRVSSSNKDRFVPVEFKVPTVSARAVNATVIVCGVCWTDSVIHLSCLHPRDEPSNLCLATSTTFGSNTFIFQFQCLILLLT